MARVFTISFSFREESYNAVVSVKELPLFMEYTLLNLDFELLTYLPGNKLLSTSPMNYFFPDVSPLHSKELMTAIVKAVARHLQSVNNKDKF